MAAPFNSATGPDLQLLRQLTRDNLVLHLESVVGRKDLVLDTSLMRPLDRIAGASLLKQHGVDKIFKLEPGKPLQGADQRIYMVRPEMLLVKYIADQINAEVNAEVKRSYKILFVPRKLHVCELVLENEGVHGYVTLDEYQLDFIPLDNDLLSLEFPHFLNSFFLDNDQTWCHTAAKALVNIQQVFGLIPNVYCQGKCSKIVHDLVKLIFEEEGEPNQLRNEIGHIFLIDRDVDFVTPLCTQVTYEGLLDDTFGISSGFIEFGSEVTGTDKSMKMLLTSQDSVYEDIRDRHFSNVFGFLSAKAKELQAGYDKRHMLSSVSDMKNFVANDLKGLKQQHKSLTVHIGACESILSKTKTKKDFEEQLRTEHSLLEGVDSRENLTYLEELINRQYDPTIILRLISLMSLTQGGLQRQTYQFLKQQFLQSFGFEHLLTFHNLKKLGLIVEKEQAGTSTKHLNKLAAAANIPKSSNFRALCKKLHLIPKSAEEINLKMPTDMSYVFSGAFSPPVCKFIEQVLSRETLTGLEDVCKLMQGPTFSDIKPKSVKGVQYKANSPKGGKSSLTIEGGVGAAKNPASRVVLVYFLGGCTFTEITALRFLGKLRGYKFIIATTNMLNGHRLVDSMMETPS